jgi:hypothetical protein
MGIAPVTAPGMLGIGYGTLVLFSVLGVLDPLPGPLIGVISTIDCEPP